MTLNRKLQGSATASVVMVAILALGGCVSSDGLSTKGRMTDISALSAGKSLDVSSTRGSTRFASTWPAADWWHALGDPQLDALIDEAMQGNPDLTAADARLRKAMASAVAADAARKPNISGSASVQAIHVPSDVLPGGATDEDFTPKILGLSGSYSGSLLGMRHATWEAALGREHAMEVETRAARLALSAEVTRTYARLAHAHFAHDLAAQDVERSSSFLALTTQRVKAGIDGMQQQRLAEASSASSRKQLEQASHEIEREQIALAVLVGKGPDRGMEIGRPAMLHPVALALPDNLPADLLGRRPDIVAARWRVEAAAKDIEAAKAGFYPSFNLNAAIGLVSFHTDQLLSLRSRYFSVAPALSLPIFDADRLRAGLAGGNAGFDLAVADYNKTLVGALNDVALQMRSVRSLDNEAAVQRQAVESARDGWQMASQRYRRGIASQLETLAMQQAVLNAEAAMADIEAAQIESAIRLVQSLGGGYAAAQNEMPPDTINKNQTSGTPS